MRIISNFHDYYDCIQRLGQDPTVIYLRKEKTVEGWPFPHCYGSCEINGKDSLTQVYVIGFCGNISPMIEFFDEKILQCVRCWSLADVDYFMSQYLKTSAWYAYHESKWSHKFAYNNRRVHFKKFFDKCAQQKIQYEYLFREHHAPVFIAKTDGRWKKNSKIIYNACLKDVEFYTRVNNYQAFQEIAMYLGGILGSHGGHKTKYKGEPMSMEVSDRDLISAKGFDKYSFRKQGTQPVGSLGNRGTQ